MISPPVLSAIQAKAIGPNAGGEGKWVAQSDGGQGENADRRSFSLKPYTAWIVVILTGSSISFWGNRTDPPPGKESRRRSKVIDGRKFNALTIF